MIARTYGTAELQGDASPPFKSRLSLAGKVALGLIACAVIMAPDTRQASAISQLEQWPAPLKGSAPLKDKIQQLTTRVAALENYIQAASDSKGGSCSLLGRDVCTTLKQIEDADRSARDAQQDGKPTVAEAIADLQNRVVAMEQYLQTGSSNESAPVTSMTLKDQVQDLQSRVGAIRKYLVDQAKQSGASGTSRFLEMLKGQIGVPKFDEKMVGSFGEWAGTPGARLLDKGQATPAESRAVVEALNGTSDAFSVHAGLLKDSECAALRSHLDMQYARGTLAGEADLKLNISLTELESLVGTAAADRLVDFCGGHFDTIIIRRCKPGGQIINFHKDDHLRTILIALVDDEEYKGGRLVFATRDGLRVPPRPAGTATVHTSAVVHGVTRHTAGVRYGLFFLQGMGGVGTLSDLGVDDQDDSGATYVATNATNGTTTQDTPSAVITGMDGLYRVDVDQLDVDMMKLA